MHQTNHFNLSTRRFRLDLSSEFPTESACLPSTIKSEPEPQFTPRSIPLARSEGIFPEITVSPVLCEDGSLTLLFLNPSY